MFVLSLAPPQGFHRGLDKYDPTRGTALSTVAYQWVQQSVLRAVQRDSRVIRLPQTLQERMHQVSDSGVSSLPCSYCS